MEATLPKTLKTPPQRPTISFGAVSEITYQPSAPNPLPKKASAISMTTSVVLLV